MKSLDYQLTDAENTPGSWTSMLTSVSKEPIFTKISTTQFAHFASSASCCCSSEGTEIP